MYSGKLEIISKLLMDYNFESHSEIPTNLKCNYCRNILNNACQVSCGCRFCLHCIDELLKNHLQFCPGNSEFCHEESLSNFQYDFNTNNEIAQLFLKCPTEMCNYHCELVDMVQHLRICSLKYVRCPFYDFGCTRDNILITNIDEHIYSDSFQHTNILINMILDLKDEVIELRRREEDNRNEIDNIKRMLRKENESIQSFNCQISTEKIDSKSKERITSNLMGKGEEEIFGFSMDKFDKLTLEIDGRLSEMCKTWTHSLEEQVRRINNHHNHHHMIIMSRINEADRLLDLQMNGALIWSIDKLAERRSKIECIYSDEFSSPVSPYKMRLAINAYDTNLLIYLRVYRGNVDLDLAWPMCAKISIDIGNRCHPGVHRNITKRCNVAKPINTSYQCSDLFTFFYSDLNLAGLLEKDCLIIECFVDVE